MSITDYDVSRDDREVAYTVIEANGDSSIWVAPLDRRAAPRQVVQGGDQVSFGADGELVFRSLEQKAANVLGRVRTDGTNRERLTAVPVLDKFGVSPDGRWAIVYAAGDEATDPGTVAVPLRGGRPTIVCGLCPAGWSHDAKMFYVSIEQSAYWSPRASWARAGSLSGKTLAIPVTAEHSLPELPSGGINPAASGADVKGARVITHGAVSPGRDPGTYVFAKTELQRNLFRISLQ